MDISYSFKGTTEGSGLIQSRYLRQVDLPVTSEKECSDWNGSGYDPTTMLCAGAIGDGKDACQGDRQVYFILFIFVCSYMYLTCLLYYLVVVH